MYFSLCCTHSLSSIFQASVLELHALREQLRRAADTARQRDDELTHALQRIEAYEQGTYGLRDAVRDIKELRLQVIGVEEKREQNRERYKNVT